MKTKQQIWDRVKRDQVLNLSELAFASGYPRSALGAMKLPLIGGKISLSDFKRILHQRQDQRENATAGLDVVDDERSRRQASPDIALRYPGISPSAVDLFFGTKKVTTKRMAA